MSFSKASFCGISIAVEVRTAMHKKIVCLLAFSLLAAATLAEAQQQEKDRRIGYLPAGQSTSESTRIEAFRQGLRELGYVEGKNIIIEYRYAEGKFERVPDLA